MIKNGLITLMFLFATLFTHAQETGENKWGAWYMYFGTFKIAEKLSIHTEAQFRYYEMTDNFNQMLLRTGLNYHINDKYTVTAGYGFIETDGRFEEFPNEPNASEHRIFEQLVINNHWGKVNLNHRYRIEQRVLNNAGDNDFQNRIRYRLQVSYPLSDIFYIDVYDEVFLNLQNEVFGQNRLYGAVRAKLNDNLQLAVGYLKNHFNSAHFDRVQLAVLFNTDLRKNK